MHSTHRIIAFIFLGIFANVAFSTRPVGIHFDIEPASLPEGAEALASQFLALLTSIKAVTNGQTQLTVDIPMGMGPETGGWTYNGNPISNYVLDIVDVVALMSYRNHAAPPNGIIDHTEGFLQYAQTVGKKVRAGVETGCASDGVTPSTITFCGFSEANFESNLNSAWTTLAAAYPTAFDGINVEQDQTYINLVGNSDGSLTQRPRGVWVWDHNYITSLSDQTTFLDFCVAHKISLIIQESTGYVGDAQLTTLIENAYSRGIEVELLFGEADWTYTANHGVPVGIAQQVVDYINSLPPNPSSGSSTTGKHVAATTGKHVVATTGKHVVATTGTTGQPTKGTSAYGTSSATTQSPYNVIVSFVVSVPTPSSSFSADTFVGDLATALQIPAGAIQEVEVDFDLSSSVTTVVTFILINYANVDPVQTAQNLQNLIENKSAVLTANNLERIALISESSNQSETAAATSSTASAKYVIIGSCFGAAGALIIVGVVAMGFLAYRRRKATSQSNTATEHSLSSA